MELPELYLIEQHFPRPREGDPAAAVVRELDALEIGTRLRDMASARPGTSTGARPRIAITAGSRGIADIAAMLRAVVDYVRTHGAAPFLVAAMGSHGGGPTAGQLAILESFGVTEETMGAPIVAGTGTDTIDLGRSRGGQPVFFDRAAAAADGIIVMNRVKPHTSFVAPNESGILKMLVVGLGKEKGATLFHSLGQSELPRLLPEMAEVSLAKMPILGGIAIVENGHEETALVKGVPPIAAAFRAEDARLLKLATSLMPHLPVDLVDLLIVDEMGKNYSGTGMDTKTVGRMRLDHVPDPERPLVRKIVVLDLSEESHGNATGIALADIVTRRLVDKIDLPASYANCIASTFLQRIAIPVTMATDREAILTGFRSMGAVAPAAARIVHIPNTLHLDRCWVSAAVLADMRAAAGVPSVGGPARGRAAGEADAAGQAGEAGEATPAFTLVGGPRPLTFDASGNLERVW